MTARELWEKRRKEADDPRPYLLVPEDVDVAVAIFRNMCETGYTGGHVLFFDGM
jgi:hypothetical protein